jgi:predicted transcriptional regulator
MTKVGTILALLGAGPKTNAEIAEALATDYADVARTMAKLRDRGLVEREIYHRRQIGGVAAVYRLKDPKP